MTRSTELLSRALELTLRCESDLLMARHQRNPRFCVDAARKRVAHLGQVLEVLESSLAMQPGKER